tara:strand:+ start:861 stop:1133 length:273 start_codon:yes stop_codon:yes gene_type:complete
MSRRSVEIKEEENFVSDYALLARALSKEASKVSELVKNAEIGAGYDKVHKCAWVVDHDGTVSCKDCGKGSSAKKVVQRKEKKPVFPTKSH